MEGDDIQVSLAEDDVRPLGLLGQVQPVEDPAFAVHRGFRRVHIFGLGLVQYPAAEGHHVAPGIDNREHEAVAELVVKPALLVVHDEPRRQQLRLAVTLGGHLVQQHIPGVQGGPHAEIYGGPLPDLPPVQVFLNGPALRLLEEAVVKTGGVPV